MAIHKINVTNIEIHHQHLQIVTNFKSSISRLKKIKSCDIPSYKPFLNQSHNKFRPYYLPASDEFDGWSLVTPYLAISFEQHPPIVDTPSSHFAHEMAWSDCGGGCWGLRRHIFAQFNPYWQITEIKSKNRVITQRHLRKQNPDKNHFLTPKNLWGSLIRHF